MLKKPAFRIIFFIFLSFSLLNQSAFAACYRLPEDSTAWWKLDETSGTTSSDTVGSNHGTHLGSPMPTPGFVQGALNFNGFTSHVTVPDNDALDFGTGDFSIETWVNPTTVTGVRPIISKWSGGQTPGYVLYWNNNNQIVFVMNDSIGVPIQAIIPVTRTTWMHMAVTVDRNSTTGGKIYLNGSVVHTFNPTAEQGSLNNTNPVWIGRLANNWFQGKIDELTVYKKVLSGEEIASIVQASELGKCLPFSCNTINNYDRNLRKYWRYRDRYNSGFTVQGEACGNAIPGADRGGDGWPAPNIKFGDAVNDMGYYFSVLATEYQLLRNNSRSTRLTEEQMYYALQELNRLDAFAESSWTEYLATGTLAFCQNPPDLNGFMIRDDTPNDFVTTYQTELNSELGRLYSVSINNSEQKVRPTEISQDHIFSLYTGLALLTKYVDPSATYNGVNLVQETKDIVTRITNWIKSHLWVIYNPIRDRCVFGISDSCWANPPDPTDDPNGYIKCCGDGGALTLPNSIGFAEAANKIVHGFTPGMSWGPFHDILSVSTDPVWRFLSLIWAPPTWHGENFILQLSAVGDSIYDENGVNLTMSTINALSSSINREHIPLIHHVLYGNGHLVSNIKMECLINSAPCSGPFGRLYGRAAPYEWSTPNRFKIDPGERMNPHVTDRCREYYGLDFMVLYNLYRLVNPGQGPFYERLKLPPQASCDYCENEGDAPGVDCDCIDAAGTVTTCKKECRSKKRDCKEVCKEEKKICKQTCVSTRQTCINSCWSQYPNRPIARGVCIAGCVVDTWSCRTDCRVEKRDCKQECRDVYSDCKDVCTTGTPADREQYCRDSVVRPAQGLYSCQ